MMTISINKNNVPIGKQLSGLELHAGKLKSIIAHPDTNNKTRIVALNILDDVIRERIRLALAIDEIKKNLSNN